MLVVLESFVVLKYEFCGVSVFYGVKVCICGIKNVFVNGIFYVKYVFAVLESVFVVSLFIFSH